MTKQEDRNDGQNPQHKNYYKALDGKLYDFLVSLGDQDLGEFEPLGGVYGGQPYETGEVPLAIVTERTGFNFRNGWARNRLQQLHDASAVRWRRTDNVRPSFVKLLIEDHDDYFAVACKSRIRWARKNVESFIPLTPGIIAELDQSGDPLNELCRILEQIKQSRRNIGNYNAPGGLKDILWKQYREHKRKNAA